MQPDRNGQPDQTLHVLLVEHEPTVMNRVAAFLLAEGCDLSTAREAVGLRERVARIQPDLVLMDVLMPHIETHDLAELAARCRGGSEPVLVMHTKLRRPMLRRVIDVRSVFGIIPRTADTAEFSRLFREISDRLKSEMPTHLFVPRAPGVATSGTYAVTPAPMAIAFGPRATKHG